MFYLYLLITRSMQMDQTVIRPARDDDLEKIREIAVAAWVPVYESFRKLAGEEIFQGIHSQWQKEKADQVANHYKHYPETALVTEFNGEVIGFITYNLFHQKKLGVIGNNAIKPEFQNRGFGTRQYEKVLEIFKENGMLFAEVTTGLDDAHASARAAYEKVGFKQAIPSVRYYRKL